MLDTGCSILDARCWHQLSTESPHFRRPLSSLHPALRDFAAVEVTRFDRAWGLLRLGVGEFGSENPSPDGEGLCIKKYLFVLIVSLAGVLCVTFVFVAHIYCTPVAYQCQSPGGGSPCRPWISPALYTIIVKHPAGNRSYGKYKEMYYEVSFLSCCRLYLLRHFLSFNLGKDKY